MFVARDSPSNGTLPLTLPRPPGFDPEIYSTVPTFNRQGSVLALTVSMMVRIFPAVLAIHLQATFDDYQTDHLVRSLRGSAQRCGCTFVLSSSTARDGTTCSWFLPWYVTGPIKAVHLPPSR